MARLADLLLAPPLSCFVLFAAGYWLRRRRPRAGVATMLVAAATLWLLCTPVVGAWLLSTLQTAPALDLQGPLPDAGAIVVLSADTERASPEYGGPTLGVFALQRVRYAAKLQRATGLPLLLSGGESDPSLPPHAELMQSVLAREFGVQSRWLESESRTTRENALCSAAILKAASVTRVFLVTHAWHMPRATAAFERAGLTVVPAPTAFRLFPPEFPVSLLPRWTGLRDSSLALHEWVGRAWYQLRA